MPHRTFYVLLILLSLVVAPGRAWGLSINPAGEFVELCAPLTTLVRIPGTIAPGGCLISLTVAVPAEAPGDLGVGAFLCDADGQWFQQSCPTLLTPGSHHLDFHLGAHDRLLSEPVGMDWGSANASTMRRAGIYFWSASASRARLHIITLTANSLGGLNPTGNSRGLIDVALADGCSGMHGDGLFHARTGTRWSLDMMPQIAPANPYDPQEFAIDLVIDPPAGGQQRIPGFYIQEMRRQDRGDREQLQPLHAGHFEVRYRPRTAGRYAMHLETRTNLHFHSCALPAMQVEGPPWDDYVQVDAHDSRFFAIANSFYWPRGINLRSINDQRDAKYFHTVLTPDRGTYSYESYLQRLSNSGANAAEIWLSSWNLALEWRADWPGYHGIGRYNQENAWRLDRVLDLAYAQGIRVNLVINNHGQASISNDGEWASNPYSTTQGGLLKTPGEFFSASSALEGQEHLRRYLVARYADHPAILGWELWSEVNLTAGRGEPLRLWHEQAAKRWHDLDSYGHPVSSHWSGNYRTPQRDILALPGLNYLCVDAYHSSTHVLADLLNATILDPNTTRGLAQYHKPVLVTEYGCNWDAGPAAQLAAEYASGPWIGMVCGHAGAPFLWWFEWVDQISGFAPMRAISRFLVAEDLRGQEAHSVRLQVQNDGGTLWAHAWIRPGRVLGYILDSEWGRTGTDQGAHDQTRLLISESIPPESLQVQWWNADSGTIIQQHDVEHPGGALTLTPPSFRHHIAFKLYRLPSPVNAKAVGTSLTPSHP